MVDARTLALALAALVAVAAASPLPRVRARRQLADDDTLQPIEDGITYHRQVRSTSPERVSLLPTRDTSSSLNTEDTEDTSNMQRTWGTFNTQGTRRSRTPSTELELPNTRSRIQGVSSSTRGSSTGLDRGVRQTDDIPVFDRNKVSLDFPGSLFGPSLSLLIKTTKVIGDVIQNSAVRYQTFLRLFRPLFRGPFEIKGLDPATTTTTTTTTTTPAPEAKDNEVRRR